MAEQALITRRLVSPLTLDVDDKGENHRQGQQGQHGHRPWDDALRDLAPGPVSHAQGLSHGAFPCGQRPSAVQGCAMETGRKYKKQHNPPLSVGIYF